MRLSSSAALLSAAFCACVSEVVVSLPAPENVALPDDEERPEAPIDEQPEQPPAEEPPPSEPPPEPPPEAPPQNPACANGPLEEPIANCAPAVPPSTGDANKDCFNRINQLRYECQCLPPLLRWTDGEDCANRMAESDHDSGNAHGGFSSGMCDGGFAQNECPGWADERDVVDGCLQMMWDEGPGPFWAGHGHYINMTSSEYTHVACGFFSGNDGTWSVQNFY